MNGRTLLERVLEHPSDAELAALVETLVKERVPEDTWLDYKDGLWTKRVDTAELRRDATAFGNSDGGCLVIGVSEKDKRPTGLSTCCGDVPRALQQVDGVLTSLGGSLFPPPRAGRLVTMPTGEQVLVIGLPRSGRLATISENGQSVHYIRIGDGKQRAPEWLLADLAFGRRQQAALRIRIERCDVEELEKEVQKLTLRFELENHGPEYAHRCYGGVLFGNLNTDSCDPVDIHHPIHRKALWAIGPALVHVHRDLDSCFASRPAIRPFETRRAIVWIRLPMIGDRPVLWQSAVYVGTDSGPAQWWEVAIRIEPYAGGAAVTVTEVFDRLARVRWATVDGDESGEAVPPPSEPAGPS